MQPAKFCKAPFKSLVIDTDGSLLPCCEFMSHETNISKYKIHEFKKYWKDTTLKQQMINGEVNKGCVYCISKENNPGLSGLRIRNNQLFKESYEILKDNNDHDIGHLELRLGNFCNLKCTMCGPYASSTWSAEANKNEEKFKEYNIKYLKTETWYEDEKNRELIFSILKKCISVNFGGGEPFMNPHINDFLNAINLDTKVDIVTNGTKLPDSTLDILQKFKNMNIYLSVDGIGPHNNYIRSGSKWEDIEKNIKRYKERNIKVELYYILQHTSLFTFQPLYEYCNTNNLKLQIGEIYKGSVDGSGHLTLNSAHENDVLSFTKWLTTINSPSKIAVENWLQNYKFNTKLHERFKHYFTMLDSIRGTNFVKTFNPSWT